MTLPNPPMLPWHRMGVLAFYSVFFMGAPTLGFTETINIDAASMTSRIGQMERRIMALEAAGLRGGASGGGMAVADMELRLQTIEEEMSTLNGAVERLSRVAQTLAEKMEAQQKDLELRLQDLEGKVRSGVAASAGGDASPASHGEEAAADTPKKTELPKENAVPEGLEAQAIYSKAYGYLTATDYPNAKIWMDAVATRYAENPLADNAFYWLGEIALVQGDAQGAAVAFKKGLTAFPKGQKAAGNMLKMGVALDKLGKKDLAKGMWEKVLKDYPKSGEALKAKEFLAAGKGE
ncbi:MAG: hypothetical protein COY40_06750 [Alphaproteobacteria bacterium CG_4_10_14_0_8_um_filter_53_9]|nr:MAG: hypothetical protein COY40_06750 [Alphaproteobacteria bacterium CG_4_10_14_0_8_um_filter_53_9]